MAKRKMAKYGLNVALKRLRAKIKLNIIDKNKSFLTEIPLMICGRITSAPKPTIEEKLMISPIKNGLSKESSIKVGAQKDKIASARKIKNKISESVITFGNEGSLRNTVLVLLNILQETYFPYYYLIRLIAEGQQKTCSIINKDHLETKQISLLLPKNDKWARKTNKKEIFEIRPQITCRNIICFLPPHFLKVSRRQRLFARRKLVGREVEKVSK